MRQILSNVIQCVLLVVIVYLLYLMLVQPYWVQPKKDLEFLGTKPTKEEILEKFGSPSEKIGPGEVFRATGWHPLPEKKAEGEAMSFQRPSSDKIYIFFTREGALSFYVVSRS